MNTLNEIEQRLRAGDGHILCLGAHCDDIDIGAGGTLLTWLERWPNTAVTWVVLSGDATRANELRQSAAVFLAQAGSRRIEVENFRNGYFPFCGEMLKDYFETLKDLPNPDLIFTHQRDDRHQDHRLVSDLTWNTFRNHLILEYEIPKFDGELKHPNTYVPIGQSVIQKKSAILQECYVSQRDKPWFDDDVFQGLARLRGVECASESRFAEAFIARKLVL